MSPAVSQPSDLDRAVARARDARRTVGAQRDYSCGCGYKRRSWIKFHVCPGCGSAGAVDRAVLVSAAIR